MSLSSHDEKTGPKRTSPGNFCVWCRLSSSETATAASGASVPDDEEEGASPAEASGASEPVEEATAAASGAFRPDDEEEGEEADEEPLPKPSF